MFNSSVCMIIKLDCEILGERDQTQISNIIEIIKYTLMPHWKYRT